VGIRLGDRLGDRLVLSLVIGLWGAGRRGREPGMGVGIGHILVCDCIFGCR
jgi:hypothetical protein